MSRSYDEHKSCRVDRVFRSVLRVRRWDDRTNGNQGRHHRHRYVTCHGVYRLLNDMNDPNHVPGARVVAAFKGGSPDVEASSYADAREIVRLSRESGVPFFSSSSLRFVADVQAMKNSSKHGGISGAFTFGPENLEPHHPDLFWYGIHAIEMLYTLLGPGCEEVTRVKTDSGDTVVGKWKDGRIGTMRGLIRGRQDYGAVAFGMNAVLTTPVPMSSDYRGLLVEIVKFFQTGVPPVAPDETLEIMAFMEAADLSKARGGARVALAEVTRAK
jgi:hypothetical protein